MCPSAQELRICVAIGGIGFDNAGPILVREEIGDVLRMHSDRLDVQYR